MHATPDETPDQTQGQTPASASPMPRRAFLGGVGVAVLGVATAGGAGAFQRT